MTPEEIEAIVGGYHGDPNRSATEWAESGKMPFRIVDSEEGDYQARNFTHPSRTRKHGPAWRILKNSPRAATFW